MRVALLRGGRPCAGGAAARGFANFVCKQPPQFANSPSLQTLVCCFAATKLYFINCLIRIFSQIKNPDYFYQTDGLCSTRRGDGRELMMV